MVTDTHTHRMTTVPLTHAPGGLNEENFKLSQCGGGGGGGGPLQNQWVILT